MSEFKVNSITNKNGSTGPSICGVTTFSGKSGIQVPSGRTGNRAGVGAISNRDGLIFYADAADLKKIATRNGRTAHETLLDLMVIKLNQRRDDAQSCI